MHNLSQGDLFPLMIYGGLMCQTLFSWYLSQDNLIFKKYIFAKKQQNNFVNLGFLFHIKLFYNHSTLIIVYSSYKF